jgi:hypothetical protein
VDQAWTIVPAAGDHFSIFHAAMENGLIRNNVITNNPSGILLYHQAFYNVSILNNSLVDNGGIFLYSIQKATDPNVPRTGTLRNIEVIGNTLTDTKSQWASYIVASDAINSPNYIWGTAFDGIEVRNNSITEGNGHSIGLFREGYLSQTLYQDRTAPYSPNNAAPAILGTIFQGNNCTNCPIFYNLTSGDLDTIIWNSYINNALGQTPVIKDQKISNTATQASVGTVVGHD